MELSLFYYSVVRFVPDRVRGEAINLGVMLVDPKTSESYGAFSRRFKSRVRALDPVVNVTVIKRLLDSLESRLGPRQPSFFDPSVAISTVGHLQALADSLKNQLQVAEPKPYRAEGILAATQVLYAELVSPARRPPAEPSTMTLSHLRRMIRHVIREWGGDAVKVQESGLQQVRGARHFADFWLQAGTPIAAFIAISDEPEEISLAWARRDSVPTIAEEFRSSYPRFKTVVVFPPNGHIPAREFVTETASFLRRVDGVVVTHADQLPDLRIELTQPLL